MRFKKHYLSIASALTMSLFSLSGCASDPTVDVSHAGGFKNTKNLENYLNKGDDVNYADKDGTTALMNAVTFGHLDNVKLLLEKGANIHQRDKEGQTALHTLPFFKKAHDEKILKLLLANGADINSLDNEGDTALITAVILNRPKHAQMLLSSGANPNIQDQEDKGTALMDALSFNRSEIVTALLNAGANIELKDSDGDTALGYAISDAYPIYVKQLLAKGASVNSRNKRQRTPIWLLCDTEKQETLEILDLLLANGADINARDHENDTLLSLTDCRNNKVLYEKLKSKGAVEN